MRPLVAFLLCALPLLTGAASEPKKEANYRLSPVMRAGSLVALQVELRFRGDRRGETILDLPDDVAGGQAAWKNVRDLSVEGARSIREDGPARRVIRAAPGARLVARYKIVSAIDHEPRTEDGQPFVPWILPNWFYATGAAVFVAPHGWDNAPASFTWADAPPDFAFASHLEPAAGAPPAAGWRGPVHDVQESIILGGRGVRIASSSDRNAPIRVAIHGGDPAEDKPLLERVERIIPGERAFWKDGPRPFLVTAAVTPGAPGKTSIGGSGYADAFALAMSAGSDPGSLTEILVHEYLHTWNPAKLGGLEPKPKERLGYWFSEGFTDFYARRLSLRLGLSDPAAFAESWNRALSAYAASKVRAEPNARIAADFWSDREVEKLPYQRGALLAALWDRRLRELSAGRTGLDAVLLAQRAEAERYGRLAPGGAAALFPKIAKRFGLDVSEDLQRHVERGEPIFLPRDVFGPCATVETQTRSRFDRGWDVDATEKAGNVVTGLDPKSAAYAAGLRDGMKLLAREHGEPGDSTQEYALRVDDRGAQRVIRFLPVGRGEITIQKVVLTQPPGVDCARSLSGL